MSAELSPQVDSIVQAVLDKFITRSALGRAKYGTDLDREDLTPLEWIQHAQEEHMDAILYLEKLKRVLSTPVPLSSHSINPSCSPST
jgi:hypothetical protein